MLRKSLALFLAFVLFAIVIGGCKKKSEPTDSAVTDAVKQAETAADEADVEGKVEEAKDAIK